MYLETYKIGICFPESLCRHTKTENKIYDSFLQILQFLFTTDIMIMLKKKTGEKNHTQRVEKNEMLHHF